MGAASSLAQSGFAQSGPTGWLWALADRAQAGFLVSYEDLADTIFDHVHRHCAYVYDNAVAGIALLAGGRIAAAKVIGDALLQAQDRDRFFHDGRWRNAYAAGAAPPAGPYPLSGWWDAATARWQEDAYQVGTATGVVAWAMLFLARLSATTGDLGYRAAATRAAEWVEHNVRVPRGYAGGFLGWERSQTRLGWVSTEHNLDLAVAFAVLGRADAAAHARAFVASMWDARAGRFLVGLKPDGSDNRMSVAADANLWPLLAPFADAAWFAALDWVLAHQAVPPQNLDGIDFNDDRDGIWLEGTAYVALLAGRTHRPALAARTLRTLHVQTAPAGLVWATSVPRLTTGFSTGLTDTADFFYYRRPHIAATAWAALAVAGASPFTA